MSAVPAGPERRRHLVVHANPSSGRDYLVALRARMADGREVTVSYVPDRGVADRGAFLTYLRALEPLPWRTLEELGAAILDDVANALVPRWARVELSVEGADGLRHRVRLEERQPHWRNDALLGGL